MIEIRPIDFKPQLEVIDDHEGESEDKKVGMRMKGRRQVLG